MEEKRIRLKEEDVAKGLVLEEIWERNKILVILGLVGLILIGIGVFLVLLTQQKEPEIQIIPVEKEEGRGTIFVYLEGAVRKPGVYELPDGARLNDLLIRAEGLSAGADREWVGQNLNLAQKLVDGSKIYIPERSETSRSLGEGGQVGGSNTKISINTASKSQLESLWGIGEKRAEDIIKNRPYQTVGEILTRKIIPQNVYEKIKDEITAY